MLIYEIIKVNSITDLLIIKNSLSLALTGKHKIISKFNKNKTFFFFYKFLNTFQHVYKPHRPSEDQMFKTKITLTFFLYIYKKKEKKRTYTVQNIYHCLLLLLMADENVLNDLVQGISKGKVSQL